LEQLKIRLDNRMREIEDRKREQAAA